MALKRPALKAMGLSDEQIDSIVDMHRETIDGLTNKVKAMEEKYADYDEIKAERDKLKASSGDDFKKKYEDEKKAFADYKKDVEAKATEAVKDKACRAYFEGKNITGANLEIAMRAAREEIKAILMDGEKIKDTAALDKLVGNELKSLVVTKSTKGVDTPNPPSNNHGSGVMTKEKIYEKDDKGRYVLDGVSRQRELAKLAEAERNEG